MLQFSENQCLEYETRIAKLEEDHEIEIAKLKQDYETKIAKLKQGYETKIAKLQNPQSIGEYLIIKLHVPGFQ